jgi:hypothetical protein
MALGVAGAGEIRHSWYGARLSQPNGNHRALSLDFILGCFNVGQGLPVPLAGLAAFAGPDSAAKRMTEVF